MMELIGLLLPPLIDLINRKILDEDVRFWISVGICVVFGIVIHMLQHGYNFSNQDEVVKSILTVFGLAQISFNGYWKKSTIRETMIDKG
jgi:hypothetical protein